MSATSSPNAKVHTECLLLLQTVLDELPTVLDEALNLRLTLGADDTLGGTGEVTRPVGPLLHVSQLELLLFGMCDGGQECVLRLS